MVVRHHVKVADPAPFSGQREGLQRFKLQLGLVLALSERFADDQHRLQYCFRPLQGKAFQTMASFLGPNGRISLATTDAFLRGLARVFGDSDEVAAADRDLHRLRQGNRDFSRYYADFVRLVTIAQCDEGTQRRALGRGLSAELRSSLRCQDVPADEPLTAFADRIKRLDDSIRRDKVFSVPPPRPAAVLRRPSCT